MSTTPPTSTAPCTGDPSAPARDPLTFDVTVRVTVSPDDWDLVYGTGTLPEAVREDVRRYVGEAAHDLTRTSEAAIRSAEVLDDGETAGSALSGQAVAVLALLADQLVRLADAAIRGHRADIALVLLREARASLIVDVAERAGADLARARAMAARHADRVEERQLAPEQRAALRELADAALAARVDGVVR